MLAIRINRYGRRTLRTCSQEVNEILLELVGELFDVFLGIFADEEHLSDMRFALDVAPCKPRC
jgi:hypothetical protein